MTTLNLSRTLRLPVDAVTETFGILGVRGSGKTTLCTYVWEHSD